MREVAVVGVSMIKFGRYPDRDVAQLGEPRGERRRRVLQRASLRAEASDRTLADPRHGEDRERRVGDRRPAVDRLLGVAGAGRLVAAARRHPGKDDPVELDEPDPDALQPVEPPSAPPLMSVRRRAPTSVS